MGRMVWALLQLPSQEMVVVAPLELAQVPALELAQVPALAPGAGEQPLVEALVSPG